MTTRKKRAAILGAGAGIAAIAGGLATVWPTGTPIPASPVLPASDTCQTVEVVDGDTLHASCKVLGTVTIRLFGADAPEMSQPSGPMARAALGSLLVNQTLTVKPITRDRYGRLVASLAIPAYPSIEKRQIETGLAWWSPQYAPDARDLRLAEDIAHEARRGLWAMPAPIPPWQWRQSHKP
jgi:endonuclease YncB( thermonuclease family)